MTITVYWTPWENVAGLRLPELVPVSSYFYKNKDLENCVYQRCPAHKDELKNLYCISSAHDYTLNFHESDGSTAHDVRSSDYDQEFFNRMIYVRSFSDRLLSYMPSYIFFTEESSLHMSQLPAYLEDYEFVNNTIVIPGKFDIARWPRPTEMAFHVKKHSWDSINIKQNEPIFYLKFHTSEKIQFKKFIISKKFEDIVSDVLAAKKYKSGLCPMSYYYNLFERHKYKKAVLKEIKSNIVD